MTKESSHASSLITVFFSFFTGVDWERDKHSRATKIKTKQNKRHKVQINELRVLISDNTRRKMTELRPPASRDYFLVFRFIFLLFFIFLFSLFMRVN